MKGLWSRDEGTIVTCVGVAKVRALTLALATRVSHPRKEVGLRCLANSGNHRDVWGVQLMTETPDKTGPAWAEFCDDVLESVEPVGTAAIEAPCRAA